MFKRFAAPLVLVVALAGAGPVLAEDYTPHQIFEMANSGHVEQALQAMNEVLKNHPDKAEAHYVDAELQARVGNYARGREELETALKLNPSGSFAKPEALAALQRQLARGGASRGPVGSYPAPVVREERRSGSFWPFALLIFAGIAIVWALMSRRRPPQYYPPAGGPIGGGYGPGPVGGGYGPAGYGPPPMGGGGMGSGIVGGLASGLAIGAGVAAGEELVHHFTDRDGNRVAAPPDYVPPPDDNANMGGNDFGVSDSNSWGGDSGGSFGGDSGGGGGGGDDSWT
jgi:hypothetical protein